MYGNCQKTRVKKQKTKENKEKNFWCLQNDKLNIFNLTLAKTLRGQIRHYGFCGIKNTTQNWFVKVNSHTFRKERKKYRKNLKYPAGLFAFFQTCWVDKKKFSFVSTRRMKKKDSNSWSQAQNLPFVCTIL